MWREVRFSFPFLFFWRIGYMYKRASGAEGEGGGGLFIHLVTKVPLPIWFVSTLIFCSVLFHNDVVVILFFLLCSARSKKKRDFLHF